MSIDRACQWAKWACCYKLLQILSHTIARRVIVRFVVTHFGAHNMRIVLTLTVLFLIAIGAYGLAIDRPLVAVHAAMLTVFPLALAAIGIRK